MRSCYRSHWRLFRDNPVPVWGRYYRVRHDAIARPLVPFLPYPHLYASQRWWDRNLNVQQPTLGEVISRRQQWDNGSPQLPLPLEMPTGNADCFANGDLEADGLELGSQFRLGGWPLACYIPDPREPFDWASNVYRCPVQLWWARRMQEFDGGAIGLCEANLRAQFPDAGVLMVNAGDLLPPIMLIWQDEFAILMYAPTQNAEQALVEVVEGILGPVDMGGFSTANLWYWQASNGMQALASRGVTINTPLLLIGYSYGGACAQIGAAIARLGNPNRFVRWLSFGAPRAGDERLRDLLDLPTRGCGLANDDDPITAIPPELDVVLPLQVILGEDLQEWARWKPATETYELRPNGVILPNVYPVLSTGEMLDLYFYVLANQSFFGYPPHSINEYITRLVIRCNDNDAPANGNLGFGFGRLPKLGFRPVHVGIGRMGWFQLLKENLRIRGYRVPPGRTGRNAITVPGGRMSFKPTHVGQGSIAFMPCKSNLGKVGVTSSPGAGVELLGLAQVPKVSPQSAIGWNYGIARSSWIISPKGTAQGHGTTLAGPTVGIARGLLIVTASAVSTVTFSNLSCKWGSTSMTAAATGQTTWTAGGNTYYLTTCVFFLNVVTGASGAIVLSDTATSSKALSSSTVVGWLDPAGISEEGHNFNSGVSVGNPNVTIGTILNTSVSRFFWSCFLAGQTTALTAPTWQGSPDSFATNAQDQSFAVGTEHFFHTEGYLEHYPIPTVSEQASAQFTHGQAAWVGAIDSWY